MRRIAAVTTCNEEGFRLYGRRMIESFDRHWPGEVTLYVYVEGFVGVLEAERIVYRDLLASCPELVAFKARHKDNPAANGMVEQKRWRVKVDWQKPKLRVRGIEMGHSYLWDAVRFSHKSFSIFHAVENCQADVLVWVDADTFAFADISTVFLDHLLPEDCLLSYLARPKFSECGFVCYNLGHPALHDFIAEFKRFYTEDLIFNQREHHDSYIFDVVRRRFEKRGCRTYDIAQGLGRHKDHVFVNSPLGCYMDHMKGNRKTTGASRRSDLIAARPETYWQGIGS